MKLINLLIRELNNYSLGDDFRVSRHAEICQFDCLSLEINSKEHVVVIMEFPDWVQVKNIYRRIFLSLTSLKKGGRPNGYETFSTHVTEVKKLLKIQ